MLAPEAVVKQARQFRITDITFYENRAEAQIPPFGTVSGIALGGAFHGA